jgi:formyltetrahydrofolate deformylase
MMTHTDATQYILTVACPDRKGIVAAVATYLAKHDASITESSHFNDGSAGQFYMRTAFRQDGPNMPPLEKLRDGFGPLAERFAMQWRLFDLRVRPRVLIAVSRHGHCLFDLLHRWRAGLLAVDIPAVISNHDDMRSFVEWSGIPYHHLPLDRGKPAQEAAFSDLVDSLGIDLVVLARYMQILSPPFCEKLAGHCINIHHSFLPGFKGARPYHQAYGRGVKIIGATAHYVTNELDEGPIIEQDIQRVTHAHAPDELVTLGRDVECRVLARAVRWHIERRIIIAGKRTIVFT